MFQVMRREIVDGRRGFMIARDVYLLMGQGTPADIYQALKVLRIAGLIRYTEGSKRRLEISPGAPAAYPDGRGQALTSLANLKYFGKRNTKASMGAAKRVPNRRIVAAP